MALRFSRRASLIPGLRLNLSKSGPSVSVGHRGAWCTVGPRGQRATTASLGRGIYWTEKVPPAAAPHIGHQLAFIVVVALILFAIFILGYWRHSPEPDICPSPPDNCLA